MIFNKLSADVDIFIVIELSVRLDNTILQKNIFLCNMNNFYLVHTSSCFVTETNKSAGKRQKSLIHKTTNWI